MEVKGRGMYLFISLFLGKGTKHKVQKKVTRIENVFPLMHPKASQSIRAAFEELLSDAAKGRKEQLAVKYGVREDFLIACHSDL